MVSARGCERGHLAPDAKVVIKTEGVSLLPVKKCLQGIQLPTSPDLANATYPIDKNITMGYSC